jgi:HlyD family secretion protein
MRYRLLFTLAFVGIIAGCVAGYVFSIEKPAQPPVFNPASNPYAQGIYAEGIVESDQASGSNISLYPEVPGTVRQIVVAEGQVVHKGDPLLLLDDSIPRATAEQQQSQAEAALSLLEELKAQPRPEALDVSKAQVDAAQATLKTVQDQLDKQQTAYEMNPKSISKEALDSALNSTAVAKANLAVAKRQYDLTKAGAWSYDIRNQERQYTALQKSYLASSALLAKYTLRAPGDGTVLSINPTVGSFVSPQGAYDSYTQGMLPVLVLGSPHASLNVRCYVDEILVPRLPSPSQMKAQMSIRGTNMKLPLDYVRTQPFVSPKIELSNQRTERVDVRVLPVIFRIQKAGNITLYPGQLVDVYIGTGD